MKSYHTAVIIIILTIISYFQPRTLAQSSNPTTTIPDGTAIGSNLTVGEVEALLQAHNKARAEVGVGPLRWSKEIAVYAQEWANHLASTTCQLEHRPRSGTWKQAYGENLFMGTAGYYNVADAVKAWEGEKTYYSGEPLDSSNWKDSGHYTQVVWKDTTHVGCATAECKGNMLVVCNYDPPGNFLGQKPY
jgi:pathogenesis-related protein 1